MPNLPAWLGAITPLGGLCFILAWLLGMNTLVKKKKINYDISFSLRINYNFVPETFKKTCYEK